MFDVLADLQLDFDHLLYDRILDGDSTPSGTRDSPRLSPLERVDEEATGELGFYGQGSADARVG
jgi:hypothetical protein